MSAYHPKPTLETTLCCSAQDRHLSPNRGSERVIALRSPSRTLPLSAGELGPLAPRLPFPSWARLEVAALLHSDLPQDGSEESAGRPAFQGHHDGHTACPCPFA